MLEEKNKKENMPVQESLLTISNVFSRIEILNREMKARTEDIIATSRQIRQMVKRIRDIQAMEKTAGTIMETSGEIPKETSTGSSVS